MAVQSILKPVTFGDITLSVDELRFLAYLEAKGLTHLFALINGSSTRLSDGESPLGKQRSKKWNKVQRDVIPAIKKGFKSHRSGHTSKWSSYYRYLLDESYDPLKFIRLNDNAPQQITLLPLTTEEQHVQFNLGDQSATASNTMKKTAFDLGALKEELPLTPPPGVQQEGNGQLFYEGTIADLQKLSPEALKYFTHHALTLGWNLNISFMKVQLTLLDKIKSDDTQTKNVHALSITMYGVDSSDEKLKLYKLGIWLGEYLLFQVPTITRPQEVSWSDTYADLEVETTGVSEPARDDAFHKELSRLKKLKYVVSSITSYHTSAHYTHSNKYHFFRLLLLYRLLSSGSPQALMVPSLVL